MRIVDWAYEPVLGKGVPGLGGVATAELEGKSRDKDDRYASHINPDGSPHARYRVS